MLALYELVPLYKQKLWRDLGANVALWVLSFTIAILLALGVDIPSPEKPIRMVVTSLFGK